MLFAIIDRERFVLPIGESLLGGEGDDALPVPSLAAIGPVAEFVVGPDGTASVRRTGAAAVVVDGACVDGAPVPLVHGSRLEVEGVRVLFGDMRASGKTDPVTSVSDDAFAAFAEVGVPEPTASTGGRLIARDSGVTYPVPDEGVVLGRDPECGIPLSSKTVSRRHARVVPGLLGYVLSDISANGVFVNAVRIDGTRLLANGDIVRMGDEEFEFQADPSSFEPEQSHESRVPADPAPEPAVALPPQPRTSQLLATLEIVNEGALRGTRFRIERPTAHVGRGAHNEVRLRDDSVSSAHATLTRQGSGWVVLDLGSTNGTYVDGERVAAERRLDGVSEIRFGNVKLVFRTIGGTGEEEPSTRAVVGVTDEQVRRRG